MFANHKPFYFVFSNNDELFFLDSMIQLKLDDFLWFQLRKNGYTNIYHIKDGQDHVKLLLPDHATLAAFRETKPLLVRIPESPGRFPVEVMMKTDVFSKWLLRKALLDAPGKSAFIFQPSLFSKILKNDRTRLDQLLYDQASRTNPIILSFPMRFSEAALEQFFSHHSIFALSNKNQNSLCPPLYNIIHSDDSIRIFERLQTTMGECFNQIGAITFSQLRTMIRYLSFHNELDWSDDKILELTNFLYWYVYSPALRSVVKEPIREYSTYRELYQYLISPASIRTIEERIAVLKNSRPGLSLIQILHEFQPLDKNEGRVRCHIALDLQPLRQFASLPCPESIPGSPLTVDPVLWNANQQYVCSPHNRPISQLCLDSMAKFLEIFQEARLLGDNRTLIRAAYCLTYCVDNLYCKQDLSEIFGYQTTWLDFSRKCHFLLRSNQTGNDQEVLILDQALTEIDHAPPGAHRLFSAKETLQAFEKLLSETTTGNASIRSAKYCSPKAQQAVLNEFLNHN